MAGIYIHIPFCKQACTYCNFHFSTNRSLQGELVNMLMKELIQRKDYLSGADIETIYFGGGTPSLLSIFELTGLLKTIYTYYPVTPHCEITMEVNPDDVDLSYYQELRSLGINRLSIGIQSFYPEAMEYMHRIHTADQSRQAILQAEMAGFKNISIDLIYGVPEVDDTQWTHQLQEVWSLPIQHLSCYALTVEPKTILHHQIKTLQVQAPTDDTMISQLTILMEESEKHGFEQYEISNYALQGFRSKHNSSYWHQLPYLGIGPAAHSYNGYSRQINISNNPLFIQKLKNNEPYFETEMLTEANKYNEYVMTTIRTVEGINLSPLSSDEQSFLLQAVQPFVDQQLLQWVDNHVKLTRSGIFLADYITSGLFKA